MGDPSDVHYPCFVINRVNDTIIPNANSPAVPITVQLLTPGWTWIRGEFADSRNYAPDDIARQISNRMLKKILGEGF